MTSAENLETFNRLHPRSGDPQFPTRFGPRGYTRPGIADLAPDEDWRRAARIPAEHLPEVDEFYAPSEIPITEMAVSQLNREIQKTRSLEWAERAVTRDSPKLSGLEHAQQVARYARTHFENHTEFTWAQRNRATLINSGAGAAAAAVMAGGTMFGNSQMPAGDPRALVPATVVVLSAIAAATTFGATRGLTKKHDGEHGADRGALSTLLRR